ncbi:methyltransferase domain-containing protein [Sphingorhabdus pulchriflava]|uniref:Methyltransferase domain-containing protein n=2 Tax=Sphingorhabdus pulchriflava TaxID=2292257 RepID=A0A371BJN7_9SPHN|nr:methyltransferase domain-containing protein [Sphingorhabdus pulchriflava]
MQQASPPEIFDRHRRRALQVRAMHRSQRRQFLWDILFDDVADRLACTTRDFESCLIIGPLACRAEELTAGKAGAVATLTIADEDRLDLSAEEYDLIIAAGTLDSVNDLPGALIQIRRSLRPDGLFLGAMFGAGTLTSLKKTMLTADGEKTTAHIHPQIELRSAADLLSRTGFALPVADKIGYDVRYSSWKTAVADLRDAGLGNCLAGHRRYLGRDYPQKLDMAWAQQAGDDAKVTERFEFIHLSGWAPSPDQPRPAARGSGKVSLATTLGKTGL